MKRLTALGLTALVALTASACWRTYPVDEQPHGCAFRRERGELVHRYRCTIPAGYPCGPNLPPCVDHTGTLTLDHLVTQADLRWNRPGGAGTAYCWPVDMTRPDSGCTWIDAQP